MSKTVFCRKFKQELPALPAPPIPGEAGNDIFANISQKAWDEWLKHQTMLINEKHLNMMDPEARKYLGQQRDKFFSGEDYDQAEGYVPPEKEA